jgi:V8-like Glu-specific endopeptidase
MKIVSIIICNFLLLITSCGKNSSSSPAPKTVRILPEQVTEVLGNQRFQCASTDGSPCPDGVGRVFILNPADPNTSKLCSGFLISATRLVTNNHCLSSQDECNNTYVSIYSNSGYQNAKCISIVSSQVDGTSNQNKTIDYTVMELDQAMTIRPFNLSSTTVAIGDALRAWVVDQINLLDSRITELDCTMNGTSFSLELKNCPAISGNSGSPVFNSSNEVVGILWGTTAKGIDEQTPLDQRRAMSVFAFVTDEKYFQPFAH